MLFESEENHVAEAAIGDQAVSGGGERLREWRRSSDVLTPLTSPRSSGHPTSRMV